MHLDEVEKKVTILERLKSKKVIIPIGILGMFFTIGIFFITYDEDSVVTSNDIIIQDIPEEEVEEEFLEEVVIDESFAYLEKS